MEIPGSKLSAFLFPHSHASEREIKSLLSFFDNLTIFQPWHIENQFSVPSEWGLRVLRPPEHLRPIEGFPSLLSEYKNWMRQCKDKGYASVLAAVQYGKSNDCTWDIRRSIRGLDERADQSQTSATQWHLLLHLARETEERLREAGEVLTVLREKGSPLRDAMAGDEAQEVLNDLSDFEPEREMDEEIIGRVFGAWHGLFSEMLKENASLITLSPPVFETLSELWSEYRSDESDEEILRFCWPDLSQLDTSEFHLKKSEMEGHERMREFKDALQEFMRNPIRQLKMLSGLAKGLERDSAGKGKEMLRFRLRIFGADPGPGLRKKMLNGVSGKFLFLLEESCRG
ncbi:MAG: hypothetical protein CVU57_26780 [Deltaproteobacteria bacterium HGW-Deltaproteobacteria-15]|nr:MAG: hypothetical protein CVU57_26780 [Deltaproteobacteria bacterium HGW-Deltaproteobacteria-15]